MKFFKKINTKILNYSAWISMLTIFFKGRILTNSDGSYSQYGYPYGFFTRSSVIKSNSEWILSDFTLDFLQLLFNIIFYYIILIIVTKLVNSCIKAYRTHKNNTAN